MSQVEMAEELVKKYFKNLTDKGGNPYIEHLYYVSNCGKTEEERCVGLLHDVFEDTNLTRSDLENYGFSKTIIDTMEILTKKKGTPYDLYIDNILLSHNKLAILIKKYDLEHNMDLSRIKNIIPKDVERVALKYKPNYQKICDALSIFSS